MNDAEITKLAAEAMGYTLIDKNLSSPWSPEIQDCYDPLHDDAQAMALVKKLRLDIETIEVDAWEVCTMEHCKKHGDLYSAFGIDLNRAIVECCAKSQSAK